ncbi:probable protein phosphatase 2C 28 [Selaginella moellendorffii]|nr:probable protein phosphatase 2C 28 [Selaginella moellendorffii]|eukprot:XP_002984183.2 probable protein phosphatase 2C 28 [Selaginella moellendorffii]
MAGSSATRLILTSGGIVPAPESLPPTSLDLLEVRRQSGEGSRCRFGCALGKNLLGHAFEDRHYARIVEHKGKEIAMFGVYDGHKGGEVADFLQQYLFDAILSHPRFDVNPKEAIREAYLALDKRILDLGSVRRSGSTATTCLLFDGSKLIVANVGDSRAVLCRGGEAVVVSVDHEPQKPEEREMVESKGGEVSLTLGGIYRVDRRLAMSRAFGDYDLKDHITVEPDIWEGELSSDDFFIVASDGLWHKVTSEEAVSVVLEEDEAVVAAEELVELAKVKRETDDITIVVVTLK